MGGGGWVIGANQDKDHLSPAEAENRAELGKNESCETTRVEPKSVFESDPGPKKRRLGPKIKKTTPKLSQSRKSELKE